MLVKISFIAIVSGIMFPLAVKIGGLTLYSYDVGIALLLSLVIFERSRFTTTNIFLHDKVFVIFGVIVFVSSYFSINRVVSLDYFFLICRSFLLYALIRYFLSANSLNYSFIGKISAYALLVLVVSGYAELVFGEKIFQISRYFGSTDVEILQSQASSLSGTASNSNVFGI